MTEKDFSEAVRSLRNREIQLERAGDYWSDDERTRLEELFHEGIGISEIAIRLQRTEPAVFQQIEKLDLYQRKDRPRRRRTVCRTCHCPTCEVDMSLCPRNAEAGREENPDA